MIAIRVKDFMIRIPWSRLFCRHFLQLIFLTITLSAATVRSETPQLWDFTHFRFYDDEKTRLDLTLHGRLVEDVSKLSVLQIQPKISRKVSQGLRLGLNYSYFSIRRTNDSTGEDQFVNQNRAEFEVLPEFRLNDLFNLVQRTRYEYLMDNDFEKLNTRLRHRLQLISEPVNSKGLRLFTGTELFYDIGARSFNQARTVPVGIRIPCFGVDWGISPMWLNQKRDGDWDHAVVLQLDTWLDLS
jgi:hypothetical protein